MKNWFKGVCDKCGEAANVMVTGPIHTGQYLEHVDAEVRAWLLKHAGCVIRIIHSDEQLDALWDAGFKPVGQGKKGHEIGLCVREGDPSFDEKRKTIQEFLTFIQKDRSYILAHHSGKHGGLHPCKRSDQQIESAVEDFLVANFLGMETREDDQYEVDGRFTDAVNEYASTCDGCGKMAMHEDMVMNEETQLGYCPQCVATVKANGFLLSFVITKPDESFDECLERLKEERS